MIEELAEGFAPGAREQGHAALNDGTLLKRYGSPDEVANLMLYLSSDEASYATGGIYMLDGGMSWG